MANTYKDLEDAIIDRLAPLLDLGVEVEAMPETDADYSQPFEKPRVSISYQHSDFTDTNSRVGFPDMLSTNEMVQNEYAEIHILLRSRTIRSDGNTKGIYWLHDKVSRLLYGFMPDSWGRLFPKTFDYLQHNNGTWVYDLILICQRLAVQEFTDDHDVEYPVLEEVFLNNNFHVDGTNEFGVLITDDNFLLQTEDEQHLNLND